MGKIKTVKQYKNSGFTGLYYKGITDFEKQ
jgi:hypothetical protein